MKKLAIAFSVAAALAGTPALAQFVGPSKTKATTVAEAAEARPDTRVILTGNIIGHQREEYYTFKDHTGTITAEIDRIAFRGKTVGPETNVRLHGEVERGIRGRYIDVNRLEVVE
ncbi:NirD/YgiW/YdeI family stress tolerance protein [Paracoccus sp. (in: a-proteobacteria)]|uniref:YgiW/YdeI family stress tolerance OB fold protein n=1 Tax=Paracoccus sp. TaxID=267 RepID=UPI0032200EC6